MPAVAAEIAVPLPFKTPVIDVVSVMAGVVVAVATVPAKPLADTTLALVTVPLVAGAVDAQVVPLLVSTLPLVLGATKVGADAPLPRITLLAVRVVRLVPPLATASVPASVTVPEEVIGPPLVVNPVVPPETSTLVTEPAPGPVNATVMAPLPLVMVTPEPAVSVAGVSVLPVVLPMSS